MPRRLTHFVLPEGRTMFEIVCSINDPADKGDGVSLWGDVNSNHVCTTKECDESKIVELLDDFLYWSPMTNRVGIGATPADAHADLYTGIPEEHELCRIIACNRQELYTISKDFKRGDLDETTPNPHKVRHLHTVRPARAGLDTAQGRTRAIMQDPRFRQKLPALLAVAEFLFTADFVKQDGEQITVQALDELQAQVTAYKLQLPFLMNVKPGTSSDCTASSIYEDFYNSQCDLFDPHIKQTELGSRIAPDSLCNSVIENTQALLQFWLANRDTAKHPLGE